MPDESHANDPRDPGVIRIGSRRSALAMRQTRMVQAALEARGARCEVVTFSTIGDERLDVSLPAIGGKGVFTAELEAALLNGGVDLCVHSLKDLPTQSPAGLSVGAVLLREDPRDVLVVREGVGGAEPTLTGLPPGARVGTSSLRRSALVRLLRPDLSVVDLRGNVPTRIQKLDDGQMEAIVLAGAGILRLGLEARVSQWLDPAWWLPAPAQGVIAMQVRSGDASVRPMLESAHHGESWTAAVAERAFLHALDGGCQVPVAALARPRDGTLVLEGMILDVEGGPAVRGAVALDGMGEGDAGRAGEQLARELLAAGGVTLLARARLAAPVRA